MAGSASSDNASPSQREPGAENRHLLSQLVFKQVEAECIGWLLRHVGKQLREPLVLVVPAFKAGPFAALQFHSVVGYSRETRARLAR